MSAPLILLPGLSRVRRNLVTYLLTYKKLHVFALAGENVFDDMCRISRVSVRCWLYVQ